MFAGLRAWSHLLLRLPPFESHIKGYYVSASVLSLSVSDVDRLVPLLAIALSTFIMKHRHHLATCIEGNYHLQMTSKVH